MEGREHSKELEREILNMHMLTTSPRLRYQNLNIEGQVFESHLKEVLVGLFTNDVMH